MQLSTCKRRKYCGVEKWRLIYIDIPLDGRIIFVFLSTSRNLVQTAIIHIFYDDKILVNFHHDTDVTIGWRISISVIDYDGTWFWVFSSRNASFLSIFEPLLCISSPRHIFIFCHKTRTVSPCKVSTSLVYF